MTPELQMLFAAATLQLALIATHGIYISVAMGITWGTGRRDTAVDIPDLGRRIERSLINNMEALSVFVPIMVLIHLIGLSTGLTLIASATFVGARVIFVLLYIGNVPYLRTAVWLVGQGSLFALVISIALGGFA
ncbi:MAG: MAPEG family protein [Rhodobacteraceae bacterium]|nr:MAPEG family protein [Paracoccaceae bacterium]